MTSGGVLGGRARALPAPVFLDLTGRTRVRRIALASAAVAALLVFANALANGFVLDDRGVVLDNPLVRSPLGAGRAFGLPYWPDAIGGGQYRPLGIVTFAIDWAISGGDARWFHAVNVLWHVAVTALVWMLAAELLAPVAAGVSAAIFAVHPVHVEAVSNVVGRLEAMAAVFVLAGLLAHRRGIWSAPLFFALGLLSKESAVVLVALVAANDVVLERDWRGAFRSRRWLYAGYAGALVAYAVVLAVVFRDRQLSSPARAFIGMSVWDRLELATRVVPHYLRLLALPMDLSGSYAPNVIDPGPGVSVAGVVGMVILLAGGVSLVALLRRRRWPVVAYALLWLPITLMPVANVFFPTGVVLAERTLYLASVGACLAAGAVAERHLLTRAPMVAAATASIVVAFGVRTWTRTPAWHDDRTYVLTLLAERPEAYDAHLVAGRVYKGANALELADRELTIARRLFPRDSMVYLEAADLATRQVRPAAAAALRDSARIARTLPLPR
ncbi:MAG TPA: hypothetical protein VM076_13600 [Gemmatimonadaceae bacterium]|nr:hypothetical protein [Gemmatimonadaceae bacterium]